MELFSKYNPALETAKYEKGYRYGKGKSLCVVRPKTTKEVAEILSICNEGKIQVVPQGGNTGLVGASNPDPSGLQLVLSTELLNKDIFKLNTTDKTVHVGAGFILDELNAKLADSNLWLPIDIGSSGSCNIGGLIATNAAGGRSGRYGNVKSRVLELTVVLASGEVVSHKLQVASKPNSLATCNLQLSTLLQDNSSLDFANPFIGSEGWFGIITEAVIQLEQIPAQSDSIIIVPENDAAIDKILNQLKQIFGKELTAFEGISDTALKLVAKNIPNTRYLLEHETTASDYVLLVEISSFDVQEDLSEKLISAMSDLMATGLVTSGLQGKPDVYWHVRHHISEAIAKEGDVIATDIATSKGLANFRHEMTKELLGKYPFLIVVPFGHEMIGAAHYNIIWPKTAPHRIAPEDKRTIQQLVYDKIVHKYNGTFSTEHGIGPHNQWAYDKYTPQDIRNQATELKNQLDPNGILNPNVRY
ncbi:MAG: putative oxidoreductase protein [Rickettsiaceae bacterium]|jgi:FAD/FMN-containing dehydrogenase|nr:putative oxidoreductase protein [Rickettsiaceae bacterium]